jgi:hypothetical protein
MTNFAFPRAWRIIGTACDRGQWLDGMGFSQHLQRNPNPKIPYAHLLSIIIPMIPYYPHYLYHIVYIYRQTDRQTDSILYYVILHYITFHYVTLHYIILHYIILYYIILYMLYIYPHISWWNPPVLRSTSSIPPDRGPEPPGGDRGLSVPPNVPRRETWDPWRRSPGSAGMGWDGIYMFTCLHIYMHTYTYLYLYLYLYLSIYLSVYLSIYLYIYMLYVCVYVHM